MRKFFAVILAAVMVLSLLVVAVSAEPAEGAKNYLEGTAWGTVLKGTLKVAEEDGVKVYTYTPPAYVDYRTPTIGVYKAVKELIGDAEDAEVVFSFEIRGVFKEAGDTASAQLMLRGVNPKTNTVTYPKPEDAEAWDADGNTWDELYNEFTDGDKLFTNYDANGNVMRLKMADITILDDEWTLVQTEPIYINALNLQDSLFGDWILCMNHIETYDAERLLSIQVRNAAVYNYADIEEEEEPTPEPTEEATAQPTDAPEATDAPATTAPAATEEPEAPASSGNYTGLIIGIVCGVVVIAAAVVAFILIKKKKGAGESAE
ncbi:MAG: hypothetical protein J6X30_01315 [Clostridia bacterium]|nr:hypothetical protein [Clostridia bacterium]